MSLSLESLLTALRRGALLGAASLAACAGSSTNNASDSKNPQNLTPYPLEGLGCSGPSYDGGYYGQCCVNALCYTPETGSCAAADQVAFLQLPGYPPGSGSCLCNAPVLGPFAPHAELATSPSGSCCYLVGSISCTGRPFTTAGGALLASVEARSDWAQPLLALFA